MLVLTRKLDEAVWIGENIRVQVVGIQGGKVRLGFEAPDEVPIAREELGRPQHGNREQISPEPQAR